MTEIWAKYGVAQNREQYGLLRRVTHWTDDEVARERDLAQQLSVKGRGLSPRYTLEHSFDELLQLFDFVPFMPVTAVEKPARLR